MFDIANKSNGEYTKNKFSGTKALERPKITKLITEPTKFPIPIILFRFPKANERLALFDFSEISVSNGVQKNPAKNPKINIPVVKVNNDDIIIPKYIIK